MTAYRLLTAIVIAALVLPSYAAGPGPRVVTSAERLIVGDSRPGHHAQRLVVQSLPSEPGVRNASVSYEQSGVTRFSATVSIGSNTIDVEGTAGPDPFYMHWVDLGDGIGVQTSFGFGEASFDAFVSQAGPDDVTVEDYAHYREAVERSPGWPVVQEVDLLLRSATVNSPLVGMLLIATHGAGGNSSVNTDTSPIRAYVDCLVGSCRDCGGCWQNYPVANCYACHNQPFWEHAIAQTCYLASTTLCLQHLMISIPRGDD
jgi:hypothetical protein